MKFKVGDYVRPTRGVIISFAENNQLEDLEWIHGFEVVKIEEDKVFYWQEQDEFYHKNLLELVPEESEFTYWEEIEVSDDEELWGKRIFLTKIPWETGRNYICVDSGYEQKFVEGKDFLRTEWEFARKLKPQLTRKEIAEKFWVSEDFTLLN